MTARILPFRRRRKEGNVVNGSTIALEARPGRVVLTARDLRIGFTPSVARDISRALAELADVAEDKS